MTAQHRLDLFEDGTLSGATVVCLGTDTDECRQWCAEDCDEYCLGEPVFWPATVDTELIAQAPVERERHQWRPMVPSSCRIADWINACGVEDSYVGDDVVLRFDDEGASQPRIRPGLIDTEWTDDDYVWSYVELPPDVTPVKGPVPAVAGQEPLFPLADAEVQQ